jgi:biopolymer transport protein ExbD
MNQKEDLNFEINILPILDILSVLICFLLLTAVWVQLGTIDTKQAIGDNAATAGKNPPSLWVSVEKDGQVTLSLRDLPQNKTFESKVSPSSAGVNWNDLNVKLQALRSQWPDLKTGIVRPSAQTPYKDVIRLMDQLKQYKFDGVGLSPLG